MFQNNTSSGNGGAISLLRGDTYPLVGQIGPNVTLIANSALTGGGMMMKGLNSADLVLVDLRVTKSVLDHFHTKNLFSDSA
jgi:hypothetical protein